MYVVRQYQASVDKTINLVLPGFESDVPGATVYTPTDFLEFLLNKGPFTIEFIKTSPTPSV